MHRLKPVFQMSASAVVAVAMVLCGCGAQNGFQSVGDGNDDPDAGPGGSHEATIRCDSVERDGDIVIEHEKDFTARYRVGAPYSRTIMLFGGEPVEEANALSNAYIIGLDKNDALMLGEKYPDFYLCSSPGGQEASKYIVAYDLVPATCEIYMQLLAAFDQFHMNDRAGGDRTSLRIEGAPLELVSVTANATGEDVTDQIHDQDFHLVTAVQQLTGQSVLAFGTTK